MSVGVCEECHPHIPETETLELGCGQTPTTDGYHVDLVDYDGVDETADIRDLPAAWTNAFDRAVVEHVLEHLSGEDIGRALAECHRVVRPGGTVEIAVPYGMSHAHNPSHETRWTLKTIAYYVPSAADAVGGYDAQPHQPRHYDFDIADVSLSCWLPTRATPLRPLSWALNWLSRRTLVEWQTLFGQTRVGGELRISLEVNE